MDDLEIIRKLVQCEDKEQMQRCIDEYNESHKLTFTNADRIRAMSDEELANFMADRSVNESTLLRLNENHGLTAVQIEAIKSNVYCALLQWLKQPAEVKDNA